MHCWLPLSYPHVFKAPPEELRPLVFHLLNCDLLSTYETIASFENRKIRDCVNTSLLYSTPVSFVDRSSLFLDHSTCCAPSETRKLQVELEFELERGPSVEFLSGNILDFIRVIAREYLPDFLFSESSAAAVRAGSGT